MSSKNAQLVLGSESITILPRSIVMTRILRQELKEMTRALFDFIFYGHPESFCSYTETPDEDDISLFIDEDSLGRYFPDLLAASGQAYRAIRVYEGAETLEVYGYINFLSASLAEHGVEVVYLGTFYADLLLVPDESVQQAHAQVIASLESLQTLSDMRPPSPAIPSVSSLDGQQRPGTSHLSDASISMIYGCQSGADGGADISLAKLPSQLQLGSFPRDALPLISYQLLRVLLRTDANRFFSYTASANEITFVAERQDLASLTEASLPQLIALPTQWSVLQLNAGSNGASKNTVSNVSKILAEHMIGIFYLSTFNYDFIFTPSSKTDLAIKALVESDPTITFN